MEDKDILFHFRGIPVREIVHAAGGNMDMLQESIKKEAEGKNIIDLQFGIAATGIYGTTPWYYAIILVE